MLKACSADQYIDVRRVDLIKVEDVKDSGRSKKTLVNVMTQQGSRFM